MVPAFSAKISIFFYVGKIGFIIVPLQKATLFLRNYWRLSDLMSGKSLYCGNPVEGGLNFNFIFENNLLNYIFEIKYQKETGVMNTNYNNFLLHLFIFVFKNVIYLSFIIVALLISNT